MAQKIGHLFLDFRTDSTKTIDYHSVYPKGSWFGVPMPLSGRFFYIDTSSFRLQTDNDGSPIWPFPNRNVLCFHDLVVAQPPTYINGHLLLRIADHNGRSPVMLCFFHWKQRHLPIFHHVFFWGSHLLVACLMPLIRSPHYLLPPTLGRAPRTSSSSGLTAFSSPASNGHAPTNTSVRGRPYHWGAEDRERACMCKWKFFCIQHSHKILTVQMWTYRMNCIHQTCPEHYMQIFTHIFKCIHPCIYAYVSRHAPLSFAGGQSWSCSDFASHPRTAHLVSCETPSTLYWLVNMGSLKWFCLRVSI